MVLNIGTRLGVYEVTAKIGEGGMGEVYRARDTKLDRDVALKVLPETFTSDPDRLARFEREAKVLASLNHPNIGSIYGLEEAEPSTPSTRSGSTLSGVERSTGSGQGVVRALVLELVEGPTLADRIKQGPIPLDEALPIAKQIAEALEAAHEAGVIHRDLKPANIKVKDDGTVKVLDFGLAKAFQPDASDPNMSLSPTISLTAAATQMGMVIGTAAYMSPEQAKGRLVDKRADVWALGAVLFEMLTGRKPFAGDDVSDTLALVLKFEPEWDSLPNETPARIRQLIQTCLQKNPKHRVHDVADVRLAMEGAFETAAPSAVATPREGGWRRALPPALGTLLLGSVVTGLVVWSLGRPDPALPTRFALSLPVGPRTIDGPMLVEISHDGRTLVYAGRDRLYRRDLSQLEWQPIPGTENGVDPMFSPDGQWLAFENEDGLRRVPVDGGPAATVVEGVIRGASWGPDDTIVFAHPDTALLRVAAAGRAVLCDAGWRDGAALRHRTHVHAAGTNAVVRLAVQRRAE